jgi:glycosyltransferase involved in cell wall biosynthesis
MCTNNPEIKVSVIMPIYNAYDYLRPAIDSVLDQTLREIELICVDDGSTDHSLDILKEYQDADSRVRIITENNAGPAWARNKGLSRARGEYVIFLDADDFYEPMLLERLYELSVRDSLDIAVTEYDLYNDKAAVFEPKIKSDRECIFTEGAIISKNDHPDDIFQCVSNFVWNKMFRKAFLDEKELVFDNELKVFEDVYFVMSAISQADRIGKNFDLLIHHRVYSEQSKNKLFRKYYHQVPELYARLKSFLMKRGVYAPLSRSFLNLSASRSYKIYNVLWADAKRDFFNTLHDSYAEILGWDKAEPEYFTSIHVRDFIAAVLIHDHKQYEALDKSGEQIDISTVGKHIKNIKLRKKIKDFFTRLAGKRS